ncbi:septin-14 [Echinops telfairi]|uniref:Septin-14 n=1 Tax=Echinops telfairi TaxID=9371 RepID=A0AC55CN44_ECHTE|nr:septin-14 [Echinops telfairi]
MAVPPQRRDDEQTKKEENIRCLPLLDNFGFECFPRQLVHRSIQQGFSFNILCVGETGIGKSTLIDTLFNTNFKEHKSSHFHPSVGLKVQMYDLHESNVHLKLTVVKTVGYGDQINKEASYRPIIDYIDTQFEAYLQEELKIKRSLIKLHDSRVHVCLYFIAPTGHSLKSLDLVTMKMLDSKVNIVPLIAKADTVSKTDLQKFKSKIMSELAGNGIQIYQIPANDEASASVNSLQECLPFAVVGSMDEVRVGKRTARGRQYPWGVLQVDNESHCDFVKLRNMLLCSNMEDLKEDTHIHHYQRYRCHRLTKIGFADVGPDNQPLSFQEIYGAKRQEFSEQCQREEERLKQRFVQRIKEKEAEFKETEKELQDEFQHLKRIQQEKTKKLEEERRQLEEEIIAFYKMKADFEAQQAQQAQPASNLKKDKERKK